MATANTVKCFSNGDWDNAGGVAQAKIGTSRIILLRETDGRLLTLCVGERSAGVQRGWEVFVEKGLDQNSESIFGKARRFPGFHEPMRPNLAPDRKWRGPDRMKNRRQQI